MEGSSQIPMIDPKQLAASIFRAHYFPEDLVPLEDIASFTISGGSLLEIELYDSVRRKVNERNFWFAKNVTADITLNRISNVKGVQFRQLRVWLPVDTIQMFYPGPCDEGSIVRFYSGLASESIPSPAFPTPSFALCYDLPSAHGRKGELWGF